MWAAGGKGAVCRADYKDIAPVRSPWGACLRLSPTPHGLLPFSTPSAILHPDSLSCITCTLHPAPPLPSIHPSTRPISKTHAPRPPPHPQPHHPTPATPPPPRTPNSRRPHTHLDQQLGGGLRLLLQDGLQPRQLQLHAVDQRVGVVQFVEAVEQPVLGGGQLLALVVQQLQVQVDEVQVGLGRGVVAPPQLGVEAVAGGGHAGVDLRGRDAGWGMR